MELTEIDIKRIYQQLDSNGKVLSELSISMATMNTKLNAMTRPCSDHLQIRKEFDAHVEDAAHTRQTLKTALLRKAVDLVVLTITGLVCFWIGTR